MTEALHLELVTPEKIAFSGTAEMVVVPGTEGEFGVLAGHAPFISTIRPGVIEIYQAGGAREKLFIPGGVAEVNDMGFTILAEDVRDVAGITAAEAQEKLADAKAELAIAPEAEKPALEKRIHIAEAMLTAAQG